MMNNSRHRAAYEYGLFAAREIIAGYNPGVGASRQMWHDNAQALAQRLGWPVAHVEEKVLAFHRERLDAVPDLTQYPELRGERDVLDAEVRGLREGGLDEVTIALRKSFDFWRDTQLISETNRFCGAPAATEKCRVLYMADSDRGALRLKNVDDPLTYWQPQPPLRDGDPWPESHPLTFDGVGSGLHVDDIPPEIFPVEVRGLCQEHCTTVEAATEFMTRYNYFWHSQNVIINDHKGNAVAFEKTRCRVASRGLNAQGITFITGMGALDEDIAAHQKKQRAKYLSLKGQTWDESPEGAFFDLSEQTWKNMARYVDELSLAPTWENAKQLMEQRDRNGPMCLTGEKCHPDEEVVGCTLMMLIWELDNKRLHRRQWRGSTPAYLDAPEVGQFV